GAPPLVKIADFGIAALPTGDVRGEPHPGGPPDDDAARPDGGGVAPTVQAAGGRLTRTGVVMGTIPYMAPELMRGARGATQRSDMFAFGIIAYQLLAGAYPRFDSGGEGQPMRAATLIRRAPLVHPEIAGLIDRCLSPFPVQRPRAGDVVRALG